MNTPARIDADTPEPITAEELDRRFDDGEDVSAYFDWSTAQRPGLELQRVNVEFPDWMIREIDVQAQRRGVSRQALIKVWLADRLDAPDQPSPPS